MSTKQIRNIIQTVQDREVIKLAPDLVVYIDGYPYLVNNYVSSTPTIVSFNDYVTSFSAAYDTDQFTPSCSITLVVPNSMKYLFQAPGGNYLLKTFSQLQVFVKGYYLSSRGNSVYRRVFKGALDTITYNDNGKTLDISITGQGIMRFLELMQVDLSPAIQTNSDSAAVPLVSKLYNLNPYEQIKAFFSENDLLQGFQTAGTVQGQNINLLKNSPFMSAVNSGYVAKWQGILQDLDREVHLFYPAPPNTPNPNITLKNDPHSTTQGGPNSASQFKKYGTSLESDYANNIYFSQMRMFTPDFVFSPFSLLTGRIVSRVESLRFIIDRIGLEGYQDVNGTIIVKPPLYNLDPTFLTDGAPLIAPKDPYTDIFDSTNPFIVYLSEIISEVETEDEKAVTRTRMMIKGAPSQGVQLAMGDNLLPAAQYIDIPKLAQFGLREAPPQVAGWVNYTDGPTLFATAINETVKANRAFRTYTITIPLRPELKLGFPLYIPHKDMYGYVKNISINYQVGGTSTMTVVMDSLRKRPMFPVTGTNPQGQQVTYYSDQPNLIYLWSKVQSVSPTTSSSNQTTSTAPAQAVGKSQSLPNPIPLTDQHRAVISHRDHKVKTLMQTKPDGPEHCYQIAEDNSTACAAVLQQLTGTDLTQVQNSQAAAGNTGKNLFSTQTAVDNAYFVLLQHGAMPYTDGKGYEVLSPFPWGRFVGLKQAIQYFTQQGTLSPQELSAIVDSPNSTPTSTSTVTATNTTGSALATTQAFLFSGGVTTGTTLSDQLQSALSEVSSRVNDATSFELVYSSNSDAGDSSLTSNPQPDMTGSTTASTTNTTPSQAAANVFVSGMPSAPAPNITVTPGSNP
jgi:hypothetical protein